MPRPDDYSVVIRYWEGGHEAARIAGKPPIDWAGQALVVLTLFSLTGAFIETGSSGWTSLPVIGGLMWRLLFLPIGIGLAVPAMNTALLSSVPTAMSGTASGVLNTVRQSGGAIGVALFGSALALGTIQSMQIAFLASALAFAAVCAFLFIRDADHSAG